jgi:fatty-acyl-CoA synthase
MGAVDNSLKPDVGRPSAARAWLRALEMTAAISRNPTRILADVVDEIAEQSGSMPALLADRERFTYRDLAGRSNQYARWAIAHDLGHGESVCLLMPNRPEYLAIWLGVTRAGGVAALLNTNLAGPSLAHSIDIVAPKHVIVAAELAANFASARPHLTTAATIWSHDDGEHGAPRIDRAIEQFSGAALSAGERRPLTVADPALCIYTSGTTGLPKAARVSHYRVMMWSNWFAGMMDTRTGDCMYNCLPMYHSIGGVAAPGAMLVNGGAVAIGEKFSARQFWDDVRRWDCTLVQYIGEICRYLVTAPATPRDADHRIRLACGNGLRPDVWQPFRHRFAIPQVLEFYAATEGNVTLFNCEQEPGAIGRIPPYLAHRFPTALVRQDVGKGEPARGADGFCVRCAPGEVGEAIGRIPRDPADLAGRFEGYTSREESEKKILRDVFKTGDAWFRTGDLMRRDQRGYFYFVDRIGDTFRWKGENVATSEVSEVLTGFPGILEANVYGVTVPGTEGRAGMAALVAADDLDLAALRHHLAARLPAYARPLLLRIRREIDVTATYKQKKTELMREGFDPAASADAIYFNDAERGSFVRLDKLLYERICGGQLRL